MAYVPLLLSLLAVDLLAAISPGPNLVLVTQAAVRRSTLRHRQTLAQSHGWSRDDRIRRPTDVGARLRLKTLER